ncbi:MAG: HlyD family efflux transporter periplasmic adaptor subunit [Candidatus Puniceispirillum sp.]|uniref:efflux RND transporter periplasmic adaptor subunit n=1 Tax=Candidatus Puniceispirillum sp. TaxID=2026719 RepID=UPI001EB328CA|nr:HlyD family efflux transporter periplasmic adaptor subunit [Candidatus Puniceispirillum sp.]MBT6416173.1 HlyD family efflux transporter periplasmic adaptor subunit [Candidatus Puniceispirillum sp.]
MKIKSSYLLAGLIALLVGLWMASGSFMKDTPAAINDNEPTETNSADISKQSDAVSSFKVSAITVQNETINRTIRANGVSEAAFDVTVSSKVDGNIIHIPAIEGSEIKIGDVLIVLDKGTLPEQIAAAKAELNAAEKSYDAAQKQSKGTLKEELAAARANLVVIEKRLSIANELAKDNFTAPLELAQLKADYENARVQLAKIETAQNYRSELEVAQNLARVESARASLAALETQLKDSTITSPVSGLLETLHVEKGERMRRDAAAATILGMDTLSVIVAVPQNDIAQISVGDLVDVNIAGVGSNKGQVTKIASQSNKATRTFDVEVSLQNRDRKLRGGVTVEASIDVGTIAAFGISPAHLSVSPDGALMAKISVDGIVQTIDVEMVRSGGEKVFVSGLPDGTTLLTVGQAFVDIGDSVDIALETAS